MPNIWMIMITQNLYINYQYIIKLTIFTNKSLKKKKNSNPKRNRAGEEAKWSFSLSLLFSTDQSYESATEIGVPETPNGDGERRRRSNRRNPGRISGKSPGSMFSDSCLIFRTWLWIRTNSTTSSSSFALSLNLLLIFVFIFLFQCFAIFDFFRSSDIYIERKIETWGKSFGTMKLDDVVACLEIICKWLWWIYCETITLLGIGGYYFLNRLYCTKIFKGNL